MNNHFDDAVTLIKTTVTMVDGFRTETVARTSVWADRQSVKRTEFYAAAAASVKVDAVFVVNACDYDDHDAVEWKGERYSVTRVYQPTLDHVELTCSRG